jgi:hypothetical protein
MEIIELNQVSDGVFRKRGIYLEKVDPREWVSKPQGFKLAMRCCDGSLHVVNSPISDIIAGGIAKNEIKMAITALAPTDPVHGQRYVVFVENPTGQAFLLGTVENAIMLLAGI